MVEDASFWEKKWEKCDIPWQLNKVHPFLKQHIESLNDQSKLTILFPCCGKAVDMKWLYDKGHMIVGIEVVEKAIIDFLSEQGLEYIKEALPNGEGNVFKTKDGRLQLYNSDVFKFSPSYAGKFDLIWDRAAMVAFPFELQQKYAKVLIDLMQPNCHYFLVVFDYDPSIRSGSPWPVSRNVVDKLFGSICKIELVKEEGSEKEVKNSRLESIPGCLRKFYFITPK